MKHIFLKLLMVLPIKINKTTSWVSKWPGGIQRQLQSKLFDEAGNHEKINQIFFL